MDQASIIEEMTPSLRLPNGVLCRQSKGQITAHWYGILFIFPVSHISLDDVSVLGLPQAILEYLFQNAPFTELEIKKNGRSVITSGGRAAYILRGHAWHRGASTSNAIKFSPPTPDDFTCESRGSLIYVSSLHTDRLSHESASYGSMFLQSVLGDTYLLDTTKLAHTSIVLFDSPLKPIVLGHHSLVERFCQDLNQQHFISRVDQLETIR